MSYTVSAIICAAGKGTRSGLEKNKLLYPVNGKPVLRYAVEAFDFPKIDEIVVSISESDETEIRALLSDIPRVKFTIGGATRGESVYNALRAVQSDIVLIHDGARPFVTRTAIENCIESVRAYGSGICAVPAVDTVAIANDGFIKSVPDRATAYLIQTPQGFYRENISYAYARALETDDRSFTDDSSLFSRYCGNPKLCTGDRDNIKITYAQDFQPHATRVGHGVDTHAFGKAQDYILLAGVKIPSDSGLIAHSDGDVLVHAVMDSLLSAVGLKDLGHYFPDTDERYKNADSMQLLEQVVALITQNGYAVRNVSVSVQEEKPRLKGYIDDMKNNLAHALQIDPTAVGITAGTNEGLGYVGEGKGITVYANALLYPKQ